MEEECRTVPETTEEKGDHGLIEEIMAEVNGRPPTEPTETPSEGIVTETSTEEPSAVEEISTEELPTTTEEPSPVVTATNEETSTTTDEPPVELTNEPAVATEEPVTVTEEPAVATEEPAVVTEEPAVVTEKVPVANKKQEARNAEIKTPNLLTDEEILDRGVSEADKEAYRKFYLRQAYLPTKWHSLVESHSFEAEFLTLTAEEINTILACCHSPNEEFSFPDEHKQVLDQLKEKLDTAIAKFGDAGAMIKLNTRTPSDAILGNSNGEYIQSIQEGVVTEMEIENQFANAYLNWRSWRSASFRDASTSTRRSGGGNVLRRSMRRIQHSFKPRTRSTSSKENTPVAENKPEATTEATTEPAATEEPTTTGETGAAVEGPANTEETITVEVTVETTDEIQTKTETQTEIQATETTQTETQATETETTQTETQATESEIVVEESGENKKEEEEEQVRTKPKSVLKKTESSSEEHHTLKVKKETIQNKVLRAFLRTIYGRFRVLTGSEALKVLTSSSIIKDELQQVKKFLDIPGTEAVISLFKWNVSELPRYPGMQFRVFVYENKLTAITQIDDILYVPNIARFMDTIQNKLVYFFQNTLKPTFESKGSYIVDLFIAPNKVYVMELHPFHTSTGACLFTWQQSQNQLMGGDIEFRIIRTPFKSQCFTGLLSHWQTVCENVSQQKREEERQSSAKCVLI